MNKPNVIVICGPTASGKTLLSVELAKKMNGEIVSADSMQIYSEMQIGTARPTVEEMQGIKHYLIGCVSPLQRYSVSEYKKDAQIAIKNILNDSKFPIVVGGTGLYINSLIYEINYPEIKTDLKYRKELEEESCKFGLQNLYEKAYTIDAKAMEKISPNDKKRIFRVLELYNQTQKTKTELEKESRKQEVQYNYKIYGIDINREILYDRINKRVDNMLEQGLIEETEKLYKKYGNKMRTSLQAIGYKEVIDYIEGNYSKQEMIEKIKMETRRYAKRQITWFKKIENIKWINGLNDIQNNIKIILEDVQSEK